MIELTNVSKAYQMGSEQIMALNGVNLSLNDGDFITVTGPSGSGKSSLLFTIGTHFPHAFHTTNKTMKIFHTDQHAADNG